MTRRYEHQGWRRVGRLKHDLVSDERIVEWGAWHVLAYAGAQSQAFCGSKLRRLNQQRRIATDPPPDTEKRCRACLKAFEADRPVAWRRH